MRSGQASLQFTPTRAYQVFQIYSPAAEGLARCRSLALSLARLREQIQMAKDPGDSSLFAERIDALPTKDSGVVQYNQLCALALAMAGHDLGRRLQLIMGVNDVLATNRGEGEERTMLPEIESSTFFAGGRAFSFGSFRLFPSQRQLLDGNARVSIGSRAFDILTILVERAGEVIGKEELIARVWPKVFVDDSNLKTQVSALRRSLDDGRAGRRYIVTVPGRGYNFVAPVSFTEGPRARVPPAVATAGAHRMAECLSGP
jgi:DNA-binding winged helix-turn-helix (wHTH) protein